MCHWIGGWVLNNGVDIPKSEFIIMKIWNLGWHSTVSGLINIICVPKGRKKQLSIWKLRLCAATQSVISIIIFFPWRFINECRIPIIPHMLAVIICRILSRDTFSSGSNYIASIDMFQIDVCAYVRANSIGHQAFLSLKSISFHSLLNSKFL